MCITLEHHPIPGKRSWTWRFKSWLWLPALPWENHWNSVSSLQNGDDNVHSVFYKDGRGTKSVITDIKMVWKKGLSIKQFKTYCCCSVTQSCLTLCNPMDCTTLGFPVLHHLPEFAQTPVHWVGDVIQSSHPLTSPSPPAFNLCSTTMHSPQNNRNVSSLKDP